MTHFWPHAGYINIKTIYPSIFRFIDFHPSLGHTPRRSFCHSMIITYLLLLFIARNYEYDVMRCSPGFPTVRVANRDLWRSTQYPSGKLDPRILSPLSWNTAGVLDWTTTAICQSPLCRPIDCIRCMQSNMWLQKATQVSGGPTFYSAAHHAAIRCLRLLTVGFAVRRSDIPLSQYTRFLFRSP